MFPTTRHTKLFAFVLLFSMVSGVLTPVALAADFSDAAGREAGLSEVFDSVGEFSSADEMVEAVRSAIDDESELVSIEALLNRLYFLILFEKAQKAPSGSASASTQDRTGYGTQGVAVDVKHGFAGCEGFVPNAQDAVVEQFSDRFPSVLPNGP